MKKLLIAHDLQPMMVKTMDFLQRSEIDVTTAATNDDILRHHITENANLIITKLDMPGLACETLTHTIRRSENMRKVSIMLLCDDSHEQQERCHRCGANAIITRPVNPVLFAGKVRDLLDVAPRRQYRVVLNVAVEGKHGNRPFLCSSLNISARGILIKTTETLDQGGRVACSFFLPDGTRLSAAGEIVRAAREATAQDGNHYYGIKFDTLTPDAEAAIAAFVEKESRNRMSADAGNIPLVA